MQQKKYRRTLCSPMRLSHAVALAAILGAAGAAVDVMLQQEVLVGFALGFSAGSAISALCVDRKYSVRLVVWIPLVYLALILFGAGTSGYRNPGSWLLLAMTFKAPVVLTAWVIAVAITTGRGLAGRLRQSHPI